MRLKGGNVFLLNFVTESGLDYYNMQVRKMRNMVKPTACMRFLKELRISAEYTYNAAWNNLMLTDSNSIADCCLEILGDRLYSRFFTRYTGEITCTPAQILLAYTALVRFKQAQANVNNELTSVYDTYLLTDIAMAMPDADAIKQLAYVYAYSVWFTLFNTDNANSISTQVAQAVTWSDVQLPQWLVPIFAQYFAGTKNTKAIGIYDPRSMLVTDVSETLQRYIDDVDIQHEGVVRDYFYVGVDMQAIPATTYACLKNTPLYYNGHLHKTVRSFSNVDMQNLINEVKNAQCNRAGCYLRALQQEDKDAKLLYANNGLLVFTYNSEVVENTQVQLLQDTNLTDIFDISADKRLLFCS